MKDVGLVVVLLSVNKVAVGDAVRRVLYCTVLTVVGALCDLIF